MRMRIINRLIAVFAVFFIVFLSIPIIRASNVALIVENVNSLSEEHERRIYNLLINWGYDVSLVDKYTNVNYSDFDLLVLAFAHSKEIPVNDVPTIAIYHNYLNDWGWVKTWGLGSLTRTDRHSVIIQKDHPLTEGFHTGEKVHVHVIERTRIMNILKTHTNLNLVATADSDGRLGLIAYGAPNTQLYNGKRVSDNSAVVFFGIISPLYWTDEAVELFKNSVGWLTNDTDVDGLKDYMDNCPYISNSDQTDTDDDFMGDVCDDDDDNDGVPDENDNCLFVFNPDQANLDDDFMGDVCDDDVDDDGVSNDLDNCLYKYNPEQFDIDEDGIGDVCDLKPEVYKDVDYDDVDEIAKNENNVTEDGYEVYEDSNGNTRAIPINGDKDKMFDWLIDINNNIIYDKYWDPDDDIFTEITRRNGEYYIDVDNDGLSDIIYDENLGLECGLVQYDVDHDSNPEQALDKNRDNSYDDYRDLDYSTDVFEIVDGDNDRKKDFIIDLNTTNGVNVPGMYWDPDDHIITEIVKEDADNDGDEEYLIDADGDGDYDKVYLNIDEFYDTPDLVVESITLEPDSPGVGDNVNVTVTVDNLGGYRAREFIVEFLVDNVSKENKTLTLESPIDIVFSWNGVSAGYHVLKIVVDSLNSIHESDEDNNVLTMDINVQSPTTTTSIIRRGGGATIITETGRLYFTDFYDLIIYQGETRSVVGKLRSDCALILKDVELKISGIDDKWYSIEPEVYDEIRKYDSKDVRITFTIPENAEAGFYSISLEAVSKRKSSNTTFTLEVKKLPQTTIHETTTTTIASSTTTTIIPENRNASPLTGLVALATNPYVVSSVIILILLGLIYWRISTPTKIILMTFKKKPQDNY